MVFEIIAGLIVVALLVVIVIALRRIGWLGKTDYPVSSGIANWLADINAMLQPQQPTAEVIAQAQQQEDEDEDDGDGNDPERRSSA